MESLCTRSATPFTRATVCSVGIACIQQQRDYICDLLQFTENGCPIFQIQFARQAKEQRPPQKNKKECLIIRPFGEEAGCLQRAENNLLMQTLRMATKERPVFL